MNETIVVNIKSGTDYDVYIGRPGRGERGYFGNPYPLSPNEQRGATLEKFRTYFFGRLKSDSLFRIRVEQLKGKTLGCFCKPKPCHGDIIADYLNSLP